MKKLSISSTTCQQRSSLGDTGFPSPKIYQVRTNAAPVITMARTLPNLATPPEHRLSMKTSQTPITQAQQTGPSIAESLAKSPQAQSATVTNQDPLKCPDHYVFWQKCIHYPFQLFGRALMFVANWLDDTPHAPVPVPA